MPKPAPKLLSEWNVGEGLLSATWSPDGTRLALGFESGEAAQFTTQGDLIWRKEIQPSGPATVIAWSPCSSWLALGFRHTDIDPKMHVISAHLGDTVWKRTELCSDLSWSPDGRRLALATDECATKVLDITRGEICLEIEHVANPIRVAWSPDGAWIASGNWDVVLSDAHTGAEVQVVESRERDLMGLVWSPDGQSLCIQRTVEGISVWTLQPPARRYHFEVNMFWTNSTRIDWSKKGLLTCAWGRGFNLYDAATAEKLVCLGGYEGEVTHIKFSPEGDRVATVSEEGKVYLWDVSGMRASPA